MTDDKVVDLDVYRLKALLFDFRRAHDEAIALGNVDLAVEIATDHNKVWEELQALERKTRSYPNFVGRLGQPR